LSRNDLACHGITAFKHRNLQAIEGYRAKGAIDDSGMYLIAFLGYGKGEVYNRGIGRSDERSIQQGKTCNTANEESESQKCHAQGRKTMRRADSKACPLKGEKKEAPRMRFGCQRSKNAQG
jgi:hypothetical protein